MSANPDAFPPPLSPARKAWRFLRALARPALARKVGTLVTEGYLQRTGWVRSVEEDAVVDAGGEPRPWATLPYIDFITPRLRPEWSVFEYGAGASTRFYAARVGRVVAVEHDAAFAARLLRLLADRAKVLVRPEGAAYCDAITEAGFAPDLVSIDGRDRVSCVVAALPALSPGGVIVLDDAERAEYREAHRLLGAAGFRPVEFWGLALGRVERKCTTAFYRPGNVLRL